MDRESPWKELVEEVPELVLRFFFPDIHDDLDWTCDVASLGQEMRKLHPHAEEGKRIVDMLLKAYRKDTDDTRMLHLEAQGQREKGFRRRVYVYNYRAEDRWGQPIASLVLLTGFHRKWRPRKYTAEIYGSRRTLTFRTVKVLDWRGKEKELEFDLNPVGLFVLAHLEAYRTRKNPKERAEVKLRLTLRLHERGMKGEELRLWYRLLDWLLQVPPEYDRQILESIVRYEEEHKMPYVTFAERHGKEQGLKEGLKEGLKQGIALAMELKFGAEGLALMAEIEKQEKIEILQAVHNAIKPAATIDDIKRLLS